MFFYRKATPIVMYSAVWVVSILAFWLTSLSREAMAYSLLVFYLLLPVATLIISYMIGRDKRWGKMKWIVPVLFGEMYMLAEYLTFSLANMLTHETINAPEFAMVLIGMAISLIAMGLGTFVQTHFRSFLYTSRRRKLTKKDTSGRVEFLLTRPLVKNQN